VLLDTIAPSFTADPDTLELELRLIAASLDTFTWLVVELIAKKIG